MRTRIILLALLVILSRPSLILSQDSGNATQAKDNEDKMKALYVLAEQLDSLQFESHEIFAGLSIGFRRIMDSSESLWGKILTDPNTGKIRKEYRDRSDLMISAALGYFPNLFRIGRTRLGFMAHLNIAEYTGELFALKAKSIEGGLGIGWLLSSAGWVGLTFDRVHSRRISTALGDGPYTDSTGKIIMKYDENDDQFFFTDKLLALTFHVVWRL